MQGLSLIVAQARNRVIGHQGQMPWHYSEDLQWFKAKTKGHAVIMGRGTAEALGKPLPGRRNILLTRRPEAGLPGFETVPDLDQALALVTDDPEPFIGGGEQIYRLALPRVTRLYLTEIPEEPPGDTWFPEVDLQPFNLIHEHTGESGCIFRIWQKEAS
jgi:dihydrofolate reductase